MDRALDLAALDTDWDERVTQPGGVDELVVAATREVIAELRRVPGASAYTDVPRRRSSHPGVRRPAPPYARLG